MNRKRLIPLFLTFLKIGAFTFGGGYAMIPIIQREIVTNKGWISDDDIYDIIAIAESTPGPIAINSATFVGYRVAGFWGSTLATLGVVLPAFCIIFVLSFFLRTFEQLKVVKYAFMGIRAGVLSLLVKALISMGKKCPKNIFSYILVGLSFAAVAVFGFNVLVVLLACATCGVAWSLIAERRSR